MNIILIIFLFVDITFLHIEALIHQINVGKMTYFSELDVKIISIKPSDHQDLVKTNYNNYLFTLSCVTANPIICLSGVAATLILEFQDHIKLNSYRHSNFSIKQTELNSIMIEVGKDRTLNKLKILLPNINNYITDDVLSNEYQPIVDMNWNKTHFNIVLIYPNIKSNSKTYNIHAYQFIPEVTNYSGQYYTEIYQDSYLLQSMILLVDLGDNVDIIRTHNDKQPRFISFISSTPVSKVNNNTKMWTYEIQKTISKIALPNGLLNNEKHATRVITKKEYLNHVFITIFDNSIIYYIGSGIKIFEYYISPDQTSGRYKLNCQSYTLCTHKIKNNTKLYYEDNNGTSTLITTTVSIIQNIGVFNVGIEVNSPPTIFSTIIPLINDIVSGPYDFIKSYLLKVKFYIIGAIVILLSIGLLILITYIKPYLSFLCACCKCFWKPWKLCKSNTKVKKDKKQTKEEKNNKSIYRDPIDIDIELTDQVIDFIHGRTSQSPLINNNKQNVMIRETNL